MDIHLVRLMEGAVVKACAQIPHQQASANAGGWLSGESCAAMPRPRSGGTALSPDPTPEGFCGSNRFFKVLDVCWSLPESGDLWYKSRRLRKMICSPTPRVVAQPCAQIPHQKASADQIDFLRSFMCIGACRNPASCGTNQGD